MINVQAVQIVRYQWVYIPIPAPVALLENVFLSRTGTIAVKMGVVATSKGRCLVNDGIFNGF